MINRDIILRTLCIVAVSYLLHRRLGPHGRPPLLAVNTLLLELFTLFSYMNDGFALRRGSPHGRFIGPATADVAARPPAPKLHLLGNARIGGS